MLILALALAFALLVLLRELLVRRLDSTVAALVLAMMGPEAFGTLMPLGAVPRTDITR